jgi:peptidyl-prolyl cis-trans isomerase C
MMAPNLTKDSQMTSKLSFGGAGHLAACVLMIATNMAVAQAETALTVNGIDIDSSVVDVYIQSRTQKPANQLTREERDSLIAEISDVYLLTSQPGVEDLMSDARVQAQLEVQKRGLMAQVVVTDFMIRNQATDEEILSEYAKQIEFAPSSDFKARHILVESQSAAIDIVSQLDSGADFIELAKSSSTGPSGPNGGDLGWFSPNQMVKEFSDAVAELENGGYTKTPVQTQFGWHVILREDSRASEPPTLDSVRERIKQQIEQDKLQEYLAELRGPQE